MFHHFYKIPDLDQQEMKNKLVIQPQNKLLKGQTKKKKTFNIIYLLPIRPIMPPENVL